MSKIKKLKKFYTNKKVLITGHTGFVGSWLTLLLKKFNCKIYGISMKPNLNSQNYRVLDISKQIKKEFFFDIENYALTNKTIKSIKPDIIFHLAAQAFVLEGYKNPIDTFRTNIIGTANLINSALLNKVKYNVIITTDKCYANNETNISFKEDAPLGGNDPYSSSKACAEIISRALSKSYGDKNLYIDTVRAGNILGGGDFGSNRLIPDIYFAKLNKKKLFIRYPKATRPWQNILDLIIGYSLIPINQKNRTNNFESWNIGPTNKEKKINVNLIVKKFLYNFDSNMKVIIKKNKIKEAKILMLNSNKFRKNLGWKNLYNIDETILQTSEWYKKYLLKDKKQVKIYSKKILDYTFKKI